ncbi:MAG: YraN family protein [Gammaproteobacteria bacterium]|nr:MAG: YraN family protein [Gammaproteobacteria bacterium]
MKSTEHGAHAEGLAERWLKKHGLKLLQRNYRCKCGEIDLIMQDGDDLVFIEVRQRTNHKFATGAETVTSAKQRKIINTASHYLQRNAKMMERQLRFDVISVGRMQAESKVYGVNDYREERRSDNADIDWIKNAFEVNY